MGRRVATRGPPRARGESVMDERPSAGRRVLARAVAPLCRAAGTIRLTLHAAPRSRRRRGLSSLVVLFALAILAVAPLAVGDQSSSRHASEQRRGPFGEAYTKALLGDPAVDRLAARQKREERQRSAQRATSQARADRHDSRTAYRKLSANQALSLARRKQGDFLT